MKASPRMYVPSGAFRWQRERKPPACAPCKYSADLQVGAPSKSLAEREGKTVAGPSGHSRGSDLWHGAAFTLHVCIIYVVTQMLSRSAQCFIETEEKVCSSDTVVNPQTNHSGGRGLEGDLSYLPVSDRFIDVTLHDIVFDGGFLHPPQITFVIWRSSRLL